MMKLGAKPKKGRDDVLCDEADLVVYVTSCRVDEKENINDVDHKTGIIKDKAEAVQEVKDTKGELKNEINPHAKEVLGKVQRFPLAASILVFA